MLSKLSIWNSLSVGSPLWEQSGTWALLTPDPHIEKFILDRRKGRDGERILLLGDELSIDWIESNWTTLDLFGGSSAYLVLEAQKISSSVANALLEDRWDLSERDILFCFSKKCELFKNLGKKEWLPCFEVEAPPFWKEAELLSFICDQYQVRLSAAAQTFILQAVPNSIEDYILVASQLSLSYPHEDEIMVEQVKKILSPYRVDQFRLASLLAQRKWVAFFDKVLSLPFSYPMLEELFRMLQFHFLKLRDTSYMDNKKRLSKYDREIKAHAQLWHSHELDRVLSFLKELEFLARKKDITIRNKLRSALLRRIV